MGIESVCVLVRWLREPAVRDFDLRDLVVVTAIVSSSTQA